MAAPQEPSPTLLSDDELLAAITRDLRAIYSDVIRQPLPEALAAALQRLEHRAANHERSGSGIHPRMCSSK